MRKIKRFEDIYISIKNNFYSRTKIDIARGTVIDMIFKSISSVIEEIYNQIEKNKKPYLFTNQKGDELDSTGYFLQCPRLSNETDENYFYRLQNWTLRNASSNKIAIEDKLKELTLTSHANYIAHTNGVGTATIYLIPYKYEETYIYNAINEAKEKVEKIISPGSIIDFKVPNIKKIKLVIYIDVKEDSDLNFIKRNINTLVKDYINNIAPGEKLMLGKINAIGMSIPEVEYFNAIQVLIDDKEITDFEVLQTIQDKFFYDEIIYWEVDK